MKLAIWAFHGCEFSGFGLVVGFDFRFVAGIGLVILIVCLFDLRFGWFGNFG